MALTLDVEPTLQFTSVGNPIEYLISSTNTAQPNFKFDVRVYYDPAGTNTLLAALKYDVLPNTTKALVDISRIVQSQIVEDITNLRTSATGIKNETTRLKYVKVTFQEYYGTIPVTAGGVTSSSNLPIVNQAYKKQQWVKSGEVAKYNIPAAPGSDSLTGRLLTGFSNYVAATDATINAAPSTYFGGNYNVRKVNSDQLQQIMFNWYGTGGTNKRVQFAYFTSAMALSFSYNRAITSATCPTSINIGTAAMIAIGSGAITGLDSTHKYFYACIKNDTNQLTAAYLYEIDWSPCSRFTTYEIHWLNRFGGWDSWVFDKLSSHVSNIERKEYNQYTSPVSSSSIVHGSYELQGRNFVVNTKEQYEVRSKYLREWELQGLEHLITSPQVYWNSPDGFIPITIQNPNTFEHKTNTVDKLFNLQFSFEVDNQDYRQMP